LLRSRDRHCKNSQLKTFTTPKIEILEAAFYRRKFFLTSNTGDAGIPVQKRIFSDFPLLLRSISFKIRRLVHFFCRGGLCCMPQYIFVYLGGEYPSSPEEGQKHFEKYQQWLNSLGDAVVSPAIPFKDTHTVQADGSAAPGSISAMSGMSIMRMGSMQEALAAAQACPFLEINGVLEVSEMIEMSGNAGASGSDKPN
jgi:hypothetical protein